MKNEPNLLVTESCFFQQHVSEENEVIKLSFQFARACAVVTIVCF